MFEFEIVSIHTRSKDIHDVKKYLIDRISLRSSYILKKCLCDIANAFIQYSDAVGIHILGS